MLNMFQELTFNSVLYSPELHFILTFQKRKVSFREVHVPRITNLEDYGAETRAAKPLKITSVL